MVTKFSYFMHVALLTSSFIYSTVPKVSIITSVYNGDLFIEGFLEDITRQTIFDQCELIIINANSPGDEEPVIKRYMQLYPNIVYQRLDFDPGIYGVWNKGIRIARAEYITNANVDDRLKSDCYEVHARHLDEHAEINLVYSGCYVTYKPNETFDKNSSGGEIIWHSQQEFDYIKQLYGLNSAQYNLIPYPNNHPMWRKSLHSEYGLFDERYKIVGDVEMWLRVTTFGNATLKKIDGIYSLFYCNPDGLSSREDPIHEEEKRMVGKRYRDIYERMFVNIQFLDFDH